MRLIKAFAVWAALLLVASALHFNAALAQTTAGADSKPLSNRHLMVPPRNADGTIRVTPFLEDPLLWARDEQQNFYASMAGALRGVNSDHPISAAITLLFISFAYGVFHAAGPGHGKAVISGWLLATESQLRRGILLAFMSAMLQAFVAIAVVSAVLLLLNGAATAAKSAATLLEAASYLMIAAMGLYLMWTGLGPILSRTKMRPLFIGQTAPATVGTGHHFEIVNPRSPIIVSASHVHGPDCGCDHTHLPDAKAVSGDWSWRKATSLTLAVGLRPCTGAILVLLFANTLGIYWAGVAATFVMGFGTFITVSVIAAIAVYSRRLTTQMMQRDSRWLARLELLFRIGAGSAIFALGAMMSLAMASGSGPAGM